ncbi:MAG: fluoride efflux transporter CrcB [Oscillochloridaceae bacterium umkhey_bin13]
MALHAWPNLALAIGAVLGASSRFMLASLVAPLAPLGLPFGTLLVNLVGCFLIGIVQTLFLERIRVRREIQLLVTTGFLGGLTTFSSVSVESVHLIEQGALMLATSYWLLSLIGGVGAVFLGSALVNTAFRLRNQ